MAVATAAAMIGAIALLGIHRTALADGAAGAPPPTPATQPRLLIPMGPLFPARANEGRYDLERTGDGGYRYDDTRFEARIAPDGHVTFTDVHIRIEPRVLGIPLRKYERGSDGRPSLMAALKQIMRGDPNRPVPPCLPRNLYRNHPEADLPGPQWCPPLIAVVGTFDLTDEVMNATGQGWYRYEKAKFLSATFEFRIKMAVEQRRKWLREALGDLPARLDALWTDTGYSAREKRKILCLLWSEVDTENPETRVAADIIVSWIAARLPSDSPAAYSATELAACGASAGRAFVPSSIVPASSAPHQTN